MQEAQQETIFKNSAFHAAGVPFQPSVLTVLGTYAGVTFRASSCARPS